MWTRHWGLIAHLVVVLALPQRAGAADHVQECIAEHVEAQVLRNQGQWVAARARFVQCAQSSCPALVRDECRTQGQEIEAALPSVILDALDERGRPTSEPVVSIDGSPEVVPLDGRPITLDPGEHRLRFQHPDGGIRELKLVLAESEHDRRVVADFRSPADSGDMQRERRMASNVMLVSGGVAALALGSFTYFALSGRAIQNELERCKPDCQDRAEVDRMRSHYLIADISLGVALVSAGVLAYAWVQRPDASLSGRTQGATRIGVSLTPVLTARGAGLWATGEF